MTRRVILYIASSVDGKIATESGSCDWLGSGAELDNHDDYGYKDFYSKIDTVLLGRKTLDFLLTSPSAYPYTACHSVFYSKQRQAEIKSHLLASVSFSVEANPIENVRSLKQKEGKDIWLVGGGEINNVLIDAGLVDQLMWSIHPSILATGIPLFPPTLKIPRNLTLREVKQWKSGLVQLVYDINNNVNVKDVVV